MLKKHERQEERKYQAKQIEQENSTPKGHLTLEERDKITILVMENYSIRSIAKILKRSASTISRELNRANAVYYRNQYIGSQTHIRVKEQWTNTHKGKKIDNVAIRKIIEYCLRHDLSPQTIAGRLREKYGVKIHHETIYQYIYKENPRLTQYLLRRKFGRIHREAPRLPNSRSSGKNIPNRVDIDLRTVEANLRLEFGHFECDSIESSKKRGERRSCLTVIVDRATRKTTILKTASKTSLETNKSIIKALKQYSLASIKSITYDNGCEFAGHEKINKKFKKAGLKSYFCKPYHSWEKGTVENINGLIRRFFPKGTNFDTIKHKDIKRVESWINNRPMKVLNFNTPNEMFNKLKAPLKCCV